MSGFVQRVSFVEGAVLKHIHIVLMVLCYYQIKLNAFVVFLFKKKKNKPRRFSDIWLHWRLDGRPSSMLRFCIFSRLGQLIHGTHATKNTWIQAALVCEGKVEKRVENLSLNRISICVSGGNKASSRLITGEALGEASSIMQM